MKTIKVAAALLALSSLGACATTTMPSSALFESAWVLAEWEDGGYYPGQITAVDGRTITVSFDDGTEAQVVRSQLHPYNWQIGTPIWCELTQGEMTGVTISTMGPQPTDLGVIGEDGALVATSTGKCRAMD